MQQPQRTRPRTDLLTKINAILLRPPIVRDAVPCFIIKSVENELLNAGVSPKKIACLAFIPVNTPVCVCRLADCCDPAYNCTFCHQIIQLPQINKEDWYEQQSVQIYSFIQNAAKIADVLDYDPSNLEINKTYTKVIPILNQGLHRPKCFNGPKCKFLQRGCCKYSHYEDYEEHD